MNIDRTDIAKHKIHLDNEGYSILENVYSEKELHAIISCIDNAEIEGSSVQSNKDVFAIRQLLKTVPDLKKVLLTDNFKHLISGLSEKEHFITKAIYFDKPSQSNWFVAYHQDLSISVDQKVELPDYVNWTFKKGQNGVQPPVQILQDTITIRIHLDDTTQDNGALKIIPKSHVNGIVRAESKDWRTEYEHYCEVKKGGVMLMKPLTMHASSRTTNNERRRVIHLELNCHELNEPLKWLEYDNFNRTNHRQFEVKS